jgi:hypothetical protein
MRLTILILIVITCATSYGQNLDLAEGFYEILEKENETSRPMFLRGDSTQLYFISEEPIVSKYQRKMTGAIEDTNALYFFYDEEGTQKLHDYTSSHTGGRLGFVWLGSLRKIYTIEETVSNGIINFSSQNIYQVDTLKLPGKMLF